MHAPMPSWPLRPLLHFLLRPSRLLGLSAALLAAPLATAQLTESAAQPSNAEVHLRITRPSSPRVLPPLLFGSFLEPIGHSTYGGLWADVVENSSFESGLWSAGNVANYLRERPQLRRASELGLPLPWEPLDSTQGNRYLSVRGDAGNSYESLLVMSLPGKEVGILQPVYLPVQRELTYQGTVMIKHVRGPAAVSVTLRRHDHPEQILARTALDASAATWTSYPYTLTLPSNAVAPREPVDLVLSLADDARAQFDNITLFPADAIDGMDPDEIAMARDLESPIVRFGGNFTSAYRWQDGIGPREKRVSTINPSWGIPEYNTFGTDEFLDFCKLIHAEPQIALNLGTGKPADAGDWVRYVDDHWGNHQGGLLWELGNELWGDFQIGYPSLQRVAAVTLATSQAVRAVDPHARLIATGGDEDSFHDWNAQQLTNPPDTFNYLSTHFVVGDGTQLQNPPKDFRTMAALALPWGLAGRMHAIKDQAAAAGHPDTKVAFTEWLMISNRRDSPNFTNLGGALFAGGFFNMLLRNSDAVGISDMTGIMEFGGIWKKRAQVYGAPAYWVLRTYARAHPHLLLDVSTDTPTYSITKGITRLPEIKDVPYLDCAATESDKNSLLLTCINRHLSRDLHATLDLSALHLGSGTAQVTSLTSDSILSENDDENPEHVIPVTHTEKLTAGKPFRYTFPNASVTVIEIPLASKP